MHSSTLNKRLIMNQASKSLNSLCSLSLLIGFSACATVAPPQELMDARAAYSRVSTGPANELVPAQVHGAKTALDEAESAFDKDPEAQSTKDMAYVAQLKALTVEAQAGQAKATKDKEQAKLDLAQLQASLQSQTEGQLNQAREQLSSQREQLAAEHQARLEAEKKAKEAMDSLARVAAVKQESRGVVITLSGSVLFTSGKAVLLPAAQEKLNQVVEAIKGQEDHKVLIEGHTDSQGSESQNKELSQKRADSVRDYFISRGIPADRIKANGLGQSVPIADNKNAEGRANNRRVEIIIQPVEPR